MHTGRIRFIWLSSYMPPRNGIKSHSTTIPLFLPAPTPSRQVCVILFLFFFLYSILTFFFVFIIIQLPYSLAHLYIIYPFYSPKHHSYYRNQYYCYLLPVSIFRLLNSPQSQYLLSISTECKCSICLGNIFEAHHADNADGQVSDRCHHSGTILSANSAAIFIIRNIPNVMHSIFYLPMSAIQFQQPLGRGLFFFQTGQSISDFYRMRLFSTIASCYFSLHNKKLSAMGKVGAIIYFRFITDPDSTDFYSSVPFIVGSEIWLGFGVFFKSRHLISSTKVG